MSRGQAEHSSQGSHALWTGFYLSTLGLPVPTDLEAENEGDICWLPLRQQPKARRSEKGVRKPGEHSNLPSTSIAPIATCSSLASVPGPLSEGTQDRNRSRGALSEEITMTLQPWLMLTLISDTISTLQGRKLRLRGYSFLRVDGTGANPNSLSSVLCA